LSRRSSTQTAVEEGFSSTMTSPSVSGDYLRWLMSQIRREDDGHPNRTYEGLCTIMFEKEFVWLVPNDDNRVADGLELRVDFCHKKGIPTERLGAFLHKEHPNPPCSFLEVLIGLSRRLAFVDIEISSPEGWAWILMNNLALHRITDPVGRGRARKAEEILDICIWRSYSPDGVGGFFPLRRPFEDQSKVEIWYQMAAYLNENPGE
jgi:hypothetical protein